jgi:hypothetical protein
MNDDPVRAVWLSVHASGDANATRASTVESVLREERVANQRQRRIRILLAVALVVLCPVLLWASAHGRTPLIRGAYGLMAIGVSVLVAAEWLWLRWSRQGLPGPADTRAQLRTAVFVLARQADLLKMALLWCAPIFIGAGMIAYWIARARSLTGGVALGVATGLAWAVAAASFFAKGRAIDERRSRLEQVLGDLSATMS